MTPTLPNADELEVVKGRKCNPLPSVKELHFQFEDIGNTLKWKVQKSNRIKAGDIVTCLLHGYLNVQIDGRTYLVHRILYKMRTGQEPPLLDHVDGDKLNNLPENLRPVDHFQNSANRKRQKNNTSGFPNVYFDKRTSKWIASVGVNGKKVRSALYRDKNDAAQAAEALRSLHFGEYARTTLSGGTSNG